ncbi:MAG: glutamine synthetase family protein [Cyanobacteriota bacterium]|nr:glutamine synthetase family protein [Cyanobacteriota bacterium]
MTFPFAPPVSSYPTEEMVRVLATQGVRRVAITFVNHAGAPLVKVVPLAGLAAAVRQGVGFSPVADAFRSDGGIDPAHRLARPDDDLRLRADAEALSLLEPGSGWAWAPGERRFRSGAPYPCDQRLFCRNQQTCLAEAGLELTAGFELEWLIAVRDPEGRPQPAVPGGPYGADRLVEGLDYATALLEALDGAGLPWVQFHPEYGAGQFELSLAPGTAVEAADRLVLARLLIQRVSRRFGWYCSFSPKPSLDRVGSGGHLHISVRQSGQPLLQDGAGPGGLSPQGEAVVASLLEQLPALMPLACPLEVSYLRMAPSSWAAPFRVWGIENREAALRLIPSGPDGAAANVELKVADLAANPYLLLGAAQAVVRDGLSRRPVLPPPVSGDPARLPPGAADRLPGSLTEASTCFSASRLMLDAMGADLHGSLIDSQQAEVRRSAGVGSEALVASSCWWPLVGGLP